ncbi:response regulator [Spirosoma pulveris]
MSLESSDPSFTILVVDDEPPICEVLVRLAKKEFPEADFINTRSVQETLAYFDQQPLRLPQLILLDIDLRQVKSGLDLLPELRQRFQGRIPIVVFSASAAEPVIEQAYAQGAVAYTQKPEEASEWREYVRLLRTYWYEVARLPPIALDDRDKTA